MSSVEAIVFGMVAGLSLGLTGGGGAIVAMPLLVYGLGVSAVEAVAISLMAVGVASVAGFLNRLWRGEVDLRAGAIFAAGGVLTAPLGTWLGGRIPETLLLALFGMLVAGVAVRMWVMSRRAGDLPVGPCSARGRLTNQCVLVLSGSGMGTGLLSGLFGVGGGFVAVPALVFATGMGMHRAVATSLMVASIISATALGSMVFRGHEILWPIALPFLLGALAGLAGGTALGRRLSGPRLQQSFAVVLILVGLLMVAESLAA